MGILEPDTDRGEEMKLKEFVKEILELLSPEVIGITFELRLDADLEVMDEGLHKVTFSAKRKE